jgi:Flp pilus assembly protein TadG
VRAIIMSESFGASPRIRRGERGSATVKFIIILVIVGALLYGGIQYVPVAYQYSKYRSYMQESVNTAAISAQSTEWVRNRLVTSASEYGVPRDAKIVTNVQDGKIVATVQFTRPINLLPGIWTYNYAFDYSAKSDIGIFSTK